MSKKTINDISDWQNKRVFVRVDFNVPFNEAGQITDDSRIQESLATLKTLLSKGARVVVASHLGRPKGKVDPKFSMKPVFAHLQTLLPQAKMHLAEAVASEAVTQQVNALQPGELLLLENTRFEPGEEKNDPELAKQWAAFTDIYVNDAFGAAHRAHASTEGLAHLVPIKVAGLLMEKELKALGAVLSHPEKPFVAIIGGSKISTKITVLEHLLDRVTDLVIGGGMIFTFLKAQGLSVGTSLVEDEYVGTARALLEQAQAKGVNIHLPADILLADAFKAEAQTQLVEAGKIPEGWMGLDIGPKTIADLKIVLAASKMVLWNGPLGVFEFPAFENGTKSIAITLAELTEKGSCQTVLGGGDTVAAIEQFGIEKTRYTHVSTGGGASLEFLEGKVLPGVAVLDEKAAVSV